MGKKQHSKDRLFITATEWKSEWGGKKKEAKRQLHRLKFDRCAISFVPFENPVCSKDGTVFDIENIVPYIKKFGKHPVTGRKLALKDLIKLHYHKNQNGQYICPVTYKEFNENTKIVAIRTTGNVFSYDAVAQLNIQANLWEDLLTGEKFKKSDIIVLQDPTKIQVVDSFHHVQEKAKEEADKPDDEEEPGAQVVAKDGMTQRILKQLPQTASSSSSSSSSSTSSSSNSSTTAKVRLPAAAREKAVQDRLSAKEKAKEAKAVAATKVVPEPVVVEKKHLSRYTTGQCAASFTSTAVSVETQNSRAELNDEDLREERYASMKRKKDTKKAYVRLYTNYGNLNLELQTNIAPRACHNFILLCEKGYYKNTTFHRLIPGFMIQGGDPEGNGTGGKSAWDKPFKDEFDNRLSHKERGVVSMANSGRNTNTSQFFITFGACTHLDNKHTIFGKLVGGLDVLDKLEQLPTGRGKFKERPEKPIKILDTAVFVNPFNEPWEREDPWAKKKAPEPTPEEEEMGKWFSAPQPQLEAHSTGIGKYLEIKDSKVNKAIMEAAGVSLPKKRKELPKPSVNFDDDIPPPVSNSSKEAILAASSIKPQTGTNQPSFSLAAYRAAKVVKRRIEATEDKPGFGDFQGW